ncbi:DUF1771 domain-containing protein [Candidatus Saccharibacteria bacterium]|nr:DUF1771 domain-containing protein [Candidatus Saccharibacteria bacterium]
MFHDSRLDSLKYALDAAYAVKHQTEETYRATCDITNRAYDLMQAAWEERSTARRALSDAIADSKEARAMADYYWQEYHRIRDENNSRITDLRNEADSEHLDMKYCFERASDAYESGNGADASYYAEEGRRHREARDSLNASVKDLIQEIRNAKTEAEAHSSRSGSYRVKDARATYNQARERHEELQQSFQTLTRAREREKADRAIARKNYEAAKTAFDARLNELKREKEAKRDSVSNAIILATGHFDGQAAKIKDRNDGSGKTDVYFGGMNLEGDGDGHGHVVIRDGQVIYLRGQYQSHDEWQINDQAGLSDKNGHVRLPGDHTNI